MKKKIFLGLGAVVALFVLFVLISVLVMNGFCDHEWLVRGCGYPDTCTKCGKQMEYYVKEHRWASVACTEQEYCLICDQISDRKPGHTWTEATCLEAKHCQNCSATEGEPLGHQLGWVTQTPAGYFTAGQQTQVCSSCSRTFATEEFHMESYVQDGCFIFSMEEMAQLLDDAFRAAEFGEAKISTMGDDLAILSMTIGNSALGAVRFYSNGAVLRPDQTGERIIDQIELYIPEPLNAQRIIAVRHVLWRCAPPVGANEKFSTIFSELLRGFNDSVETATTMPVYTVTHGAVSYSLTASFDSDDLLWYVITVTPAK